MAQMLGALFLVCLMVSANGARQPLKKKLGSLETGFLSSRSDIFSADFVADAPGAAPAPAPAAVDFLHHAEPAAAPAPASTPLGVLKVEDIHNADEPSHRVVAFLENWKECPSAEQLMQYTHVVVSFAVTYTWAEKQNDCNKNCDLSYLSGCGDQSLTEVVDWLHSFDVQVLLSFGGAGMGGSWEGDNNNCWDYCLDKVDHVTDQLMDAIIDHNLDGIDFDYEYHLDTPNRVNFVRDFTTTMRAKMGPVFLLTHTPMDGDVVPGAPYYEVIQDVREDLSFLMIQYYNGPNDPVENWNKTIAHYDTIVSDIFDGHAAKVVFGFCLEACKPSLNSTSAMGVVAKLQSAHVWNGGVFFWAVNEDNDATWSKPIATFLKSFQGVITASALFNGNGVSGLIRFSQDAPGQTTAIDVYFKGLGGVASKALIHEHPVPSDGSCSGTGEPLSIVALETSSGFGIHSDYQKVNISDITALFCQNTTCLVGKNEIDLQIASDRIELSGPTSVVGASVVLYSLTGEPLACSTIAPGGSLFSHPGPGDMISMKGGAQAAAPTMVAMVASLALVLFL